MYKLVNPRWGKWEDLLSAVQEQWGQDTTEVVQVKEWLEILRNQEARPEKLPAQKIPGFYEGLAADASACKERQFVHSTDHGIKVSPTMNQLEQINGKAMKAWLKQWDFQSEMV